MSKNVMFKTAPTPPLEDVIQVHSVSILILLDIVRREFAELEKQVPKFIFLAIIVMVAGLCYITRKPTVRAIAKKLGGVSHDQLTRMLTHASWNASLLMMALYNCTVALAGGTTGPSWLALDDVIIPKPFSKVIAGAYQDWDYVNKRHLLCQRLVVVMWTNGSMIIPIAFSLWHKKDSDYLKEKKRRYRTKNELARCLIYWIKRRGLPFDYLTFDSWYVSKENLNLFQRLGITYYAAVKNNRIFNQKDNALSCRKIAAKLKTRDYTNYKTRNLRAKSFAGYLNEVKHDQTLVVIKNANRNPYLECLLKVDKDGKKKKPKDPNAYFITNNLKETTFGVICCYRSRWKIEEMFRDLKQNLGFSACQHRSIEAVTRHFALCLFAYVCLQFLRNDVESKMTDLIKPSLTIGDVKTHLQEQMIFAQPIQNASNRYQTAKHTPIDKKMLERWTGPDNPMVITLCDSGGAYCLDIG